MADWSSRYAANSSDPRDNDMDHLEPQWIATPDSLKLMLQQEQPQSEPSHITIEQFPNYYAGDRTIEAFADMLKHNQSQCNIGALLFRRDQVCKENGIIKYDGKIVVPAPLQRPLIRKTHLTDQITAHQGVTRTLKALRRQFYWVKMADMIRDVIENCDLCKRNKPILPSITKSPIYVPKLPFEMIQLDIFGQGALKPRQGYVAVLTVVDRLTGFIKLVPIKDKTTKTIVEALNKNWFTTFGFPNWLHADNDKAFTSHDFKEMCTSHGIGFSSCGSYDHRQNGHAERINAYLYQQLKILTDEDNLVAHSWVSALPWIAGSYNMNYVRAVDNMPYYLVFGRLPKTAMDDTKDYQKLTREELEELRCHAKSLREQAYAKTKQMSTLEATTINTGDCV